MRCEGADNPPCRRCRNTGLDCLFEKPSREATLTGEAGLESVCLNFYILLILITWTDVSAVWRIMLLKSAERKRLSQRNCQSYCTMYVLEGLIRIDLLRQPHFHLQSHQIVQSLQVYLHRLSLHSTRRLRVLPHRSPQCIVCLRPNIEIHCQTPDIKGVHPIIPLQPTTISPPCMAIIKVVQATTCMAPKDLYHRFPASSLWLLLLPKITSRLCVTNLAIQTIPERPTNILHPQTQSVRHCQTSLALIHQMSRTKKMANSPHLASWRHGKF